MKTIFYSCQNFQPPQQIESEMIKIQQEINFFFLQI